MVFQNYALYPHLTVDENIAFPLRLHKVPEDEVRRRVEEATRSARAGGVPRPQALPAVRWPAPAGGDGPAIVRRADAFLFDEPLSNLDAKLRGQMRTEISRLQSRLGITTVYVTTIRSRL